MTIEDRLRQALAARAATVDPAPDAWARIRARTAERRRRRLLVPALAAAAAVVATVLGVAALTGGDGAHEVVTEPPATAAPAPAETSETTATAPAAVPLPETFLAVRDHGTELVLVATATGEVRQTLVDLGPYQPPDEHDPIGSSYIDGLAVTPDGGTVFYSTGPEPAVGSLYRLRLTTDGAEPERVGDGDGPQVSPDGRWLAWRDAAIHAIKLWDQEGDRQMLIEAGEAVREYPGGLAWAPNSRHLAFESRTAGPSDVDNAARIRVIDAVTARRMDESRELAVEPGRSLHLGGFRPFDGLLGVLETLPEADGGQRFSVRDPDGGRLMGAIDLPFTATAAVYDRSGRHQLFVAEDGTIHRRSGGPFTAVPGLRDVSLVAW